MARGGYISDDDFDDGIFGEPNQGTIRTLRERVERYAPRMAEAFGDFFEDSREVFERYNGRRALRRIRDTISRMRDPLRSDSIRFLHTIEEFQNAKPRMQRYLMSSPLARRREREQSMDGYSDSYFNPMPGRSGWDCPDFKKVIDGIVLEDDRWGLGPKEDNSSWIAYQDLERDEDDDDPALDALQQRSILGSMDFFEAFLEMGGLDPSSKLGERL